MESKGMRKYFIAIVVVVILATLAFFAGVVFLNKNSKAETGVEIKLFAGAKNPSKKDLESAKVILARRLDNKFIFDRVITLDEKNGIIIVQIPFDEEEDSYQELLSTIDELTKQGGLTFREVTYVDKDAAPTNARTFKTVLDGSYVADSNAELNNQTGKWQINIMFDKEGAEIFEEVTGRLVGKELAIFMDDEEISSPIIQSKIPGGEAVISGDFTADEAHKLSSLIKSGSLPFEFEDTEINIK